MTVADFCERHNQEHLHIDIRRFIQFGNLKGLLRKACMHPMRDAVAAAEATRGESSTGLVSRVSQSVLAGQCWVLADVSILCSWHDWRGRRVLISQHDAGHRQ
jgi:hypothetical protein